MFNMQVEFSHAKVKAALIELLIAYNENGSNQLTHADAEINFTKDGEFDGYFSVGVDSHGKYIPSLGGSL